MPRATVAALAIYPVKALRGIALTTAEVAVRGFVCPVGDVAAGDREWMIVDGDGNFLTQRDHPRLALVATGLVDGSLVLSASGRLPLHVSLEAPSKPSREVVVWGTTVRAHDAGDDGARWLSDFLGRDVRLVRFDPAHQRRCNPQYAGSSGAHTAFADGYPILVIGKASLDDLNGRLVAAGAAPIPMNRFRPNLVLEGLEAYDEDHLDTIAIDGVKLKLVKPCTRCQVPTTDQDTAEVGTEPSATLARYRLDAALGGVTFGMNAILIEGEGRALDVGSTAECDFAF